MGLSFSRRASDFFSAWGWALWSAEGPKNSFAALERRSPRLCCWRPWRTAWPCGGSRDLFPGRFREFAPTEKQKSPAIRAREWGRPGKTPAANRPPRTPGNGNGGTRNADKGTRAAGRTENGRRISSAPPETEPPGLFFQQLEGVGAGRRPEVMQNPDHGQGFQVARGFDSAQVNALPAEIAQ